MPSILTKPASSTRPEKGQEQTQPIDETTDVQLQYNWAFVHGHKRLLNVNVQIDFEGDVWMGASINPDQKLENISKFILRMRAFSDALKSRSINSGRTLTRKERLKLSIFFLNNVLKNSKLKSVLSKNIVRLNKEEKTEDHLNNSGK